jgi:MSHA biogenesis protein MshL
MKQALFVLLVSAAVLTGCANPPFRSVINPLETASLAAAEIRKATEPRTVPAQPEAVSKALLPPLVVEIPAAMAPPEPRFSIVVNHAPANEVLMAMVTDTRYSMLVHPDTRDPVTLSLKDVTVREALDALRELYGYDYKIEGTRIFVQPPGLQTRVFQVNYLSGRRIGRADVRVTSGSIQSSPASAISGVPGAPVTSVPPGSSAPQSMESSRVTTTYDSDFWRDLKDALNAIINGTALPAGVAAPAPPAAPTGNAAAQTANARLDGRAVVVNPQAGIVVVRGYPADMRSVESFLRTMSRVVERQVMLEAKIIEVTLNTGFQTGINWGALGIGGNLSTGLVNPGTNLGTRGTLSTPTLNAVDGALSVNNAGRALSLGAAATGGVFGLALQTGSFAALINFLETHGAVEVLSSPRIATMNNQKAILKVGTDEFFVTNVTSTTTTAGTSTVTSPTITTQPFFSGIALDVTPQISDDNQITLHIHPSVSQVTDKSKELDLGSLGRFTVPLASSSVNESDTIVRVSDGSIVAIGGLMRQVQNDARSQIPGAGDSPVVGGLFRNRARTQTKSELVILLKTSVIEGDASWRQQASEVGERVEALRPRQPPAR